MMFQWLIPSGSATKSAFTHLWLAVAVFLQIPPHRSAQYVDFIEPTPHAIYSFRDVQFTFCVNVEWDNTDAGLKPLGFVAKVGGVDIGKYQAQSYESKNYSVLAPNLPDGRHTFLILFEDGLEQAIFFSVRAEDIVSKQLERLRSSCGQLCNTTIQGHPGQYFETVRKEVACTALWSSEDVDSERSHLEPASPVIPREMKDDFLYQGRVPVVYGNFWAWPERGGDFWVQQWRREQITQWARLCGAGMLKGAYSLGETQQVFRGLGMMPTIPGGHVLVIGSESPWLEACVLQAGAAKITTLEYADIQSLHPLVKVMSPRTARELLRKGLLPAFDAVVTYSSVEHTGLGRYGDALNPWGDIMTIGRAWCVAKENAYMLLGVPVQDTDGVHWNEARFYGPVMMPHLTANWEAVWHGEPGPQPVIVFRRLSAPNQVHSAPNQMHSAPNQVHSAPNQMHSAPNQVHSAPNQMHSAPNQVRNQDVKKHTSGKEEDGLWGEEGCRPDSEEDEK
eukprot:2903755-Rhodomonas_salina.1